MNSPENKKITGNNVNSDPNTNLVWIDLEATGFSPDKCRIIQIASIVTNKDLELLAEGPEIIIHQSEEAISVADKTDKVIKSFFESGLFNKVLASTIIEHQAENATLDFISAYVNYRKSPLCGNTVYFDRSFLVKYMPKLNDYLHYRHIDVSVVKELARRWLPGLAVYEKKEAHRALEDIKESVNELKYYKTHLFKSN